MNLTPSNVFKILNGSFNPMCIARISISISIILIEEINLAQPTCVTSYQFIFYFSIYQFVYTYYFILDGDVSL